MTEQIKAENKKDEKPTLEYPKATLGKRFLATFVDLFIVFFLSFVFMSLTNIIIPNIPAYQNVVDSRNNILIDSNLYNDDLELITDYVTSDTAFPTLDSKKDYLGNQIESFYQTTIFFDDEKPLEEYRLRQKEAMRNDQLLFTENSGIYSENPLNPQYFIDFYTDEINDNCLKYLFNNETYIWTTQTLFIISISNIAVWITLMFFLFYFVFPFWIFKRGRQTIGRKIFKIALIDITALNVPAGKYIGRFFFQYLIMIVLDFFSFFIPLFVSLAMEYFSKTNQDLVDYVFNTYVVSVKDDDVYLNYLEYLDKQAQRSKTKLENNDLVIK